MKRICVFDINETLLDLRALDPHFERVFGNAAVRQMWFGQFIQSALVATVTDAYVTFGTIADSALRMVALKLGVELSEEDKKSILQKLLALPPHPDVEQSLSKLRDAGFTIATLTNSTLEAVQQQLENAGLEQYFDKMLSADTVKRLKPAREVYEMAAQSFGVETRNIRLIAAHGWDIAGAIRSGCAAAFVARPGMVLDPLVEAPDIIGNNLKEVIDKIIALEASGDS